MGKGDKRSFKGKLFKGSFGKTRPRHPQPKAGGTATASSSSATATHTRRK
jgi:ribosomal small subunit protein bTHX